MKFTFILWWTGIVDKFEILILYFSVKYHQEENLV